VLSVLLLGATGLVGRECLARLLADAAVDRVVVVARRPAPGGVAAPKLEWRVADLERLEMERTSFDSDVIICALGTTIRQAGSQQRFRAVDYGIPLAAATAGRSRGVGHFVVVSSLGASPAARNFYLRVKGELEASLRGLGFEGLTILRPSLLLGERAEFRLGERLMQVIGPLLPGRLRAIEARDVAAGAVRAAKERRPGVRVVESDELRAWARGPAKGSLS